MEKFKKFIITNKIPIIIILSFILVGFIIGEVITHNSSKSKGQTYVSEDPTSIEDLIDVEKEILKKTDTKSDLDKKN